MMLPVSSPLNSRDDDVELARVEPRAVFLAGVALRLSGRDVSATVCQGQKVARKPSLRLKNAPPPWGSRNQNWNDHVEPPVI